MTAVERYKELIEERNRRAREGVRLYIPSPQQEPIHQSAAPEILVPGGKRSGKTVAIAMEFASRITGIPLRDKNGVEIPPRWPAPIPDYPRLYWAIGWDLKHIGQTIHRILFQPGMGGQMRCIQDEDTGEWRIWNRAVKNDAKRVLESWLTEPLIPERMVVPGSWSWEDKRANQFQSVELTNGAKLFAYPSSGVHAKMGDAVSGIWIDEDIMYPEHLREWQDRLTDEEGWFLWSVWPHDRNEALLSLMDRADREQFDENPQIQTFRLVMTDNPFLTDKGKQQSLGRMENEEEIARRNRGEMNMGAHAMYPFDIATHCIRRPDPGRRYEVIHETKKYLVDLAYNGGLPRNWTRYLSIDPSHTRTACLCWVVPPPSIGDHFFGNLAICEWEMIGRRWSAKMLAENLAHKCGGLNFEAFIMDKRAGRQTSIGRAAGDTTFHVYAEQFQAAGLSSRISGHAFVPGCDVPSTRYGRVREMLGEQPGTGIPSMMIVEEACTETKGEFIKYRKKTERRGEGIDNVLDEPKNPRLFDAMASVEYFAAYITDAFKSGIAYVDPDVYAARVSPALLGYRKMRARMDAKEGGDGVVYLQAGSYTQGVG